MVDGRVVGNEGEVLFENVRWPSFKIVFLLALDFREVALVSSEKHVVFKADSVIFLTADFVKVIHVQLG